MRISDWSSDVCSSDLAIGARVKARRPASRSRVELGDQVETVAAKQLPDVGDDAPGAPGRAVEFETGGARIHAQQACLLSRRRHRADEVPRLRPRDMAEQPGSRRLPGKVRPRRFGHFAERDKAPFEREGFARGHMYALDTERRAGADVLAGVGRLDRRQFPAIGLRSEEHTSELQSLLRISYAVVC